MADYADDYKDYRQVRFINKWCPDWANEESERVRYNLARGYQAMAELKQIKEGVAVFKRVLDNAKN